MKAVNYRLRLATALSTLFLAGSVLAESIAINNVKLYGENLAPETSLNVLIKDGVLSEISEQPLSGDSVIDGQGKVLTSGFIAVNNQLGLTEVSAVKKTSDFHEDKADFSFDPSLAFNFQSSVIPYARKGGISHALVTGSSKSAFDGRAFTVDLSANANSRVDRDAALYFTLGGKSKGSRAKDLQDLRSKLEAAQKPVSKNGKSKPIKDDIKILKRLLSGEFPLLARADRPADILQLLALKKEFGFGLVLAGAAGALDVVDQLKAENVAVIVEPMRNLPEGFDSLHQRLDTAAKLHNAGLDIILAERDTHNIPQLRFHVGNAVAHGLPHDVAVRAVTTTPAKIFDLGKGYLTEGSKDIVLWSGDPFELSSRVLKLWINGEAQSTRSRQDLLRERYQHKGDRAAAYTKPSL